MQLTINQSSICNSHPVDTEVKENTRQNSAAALVGRLRMEEQASDISPLLLASAIETGNLDWAWLLSPVRFFSAIFFLASRPC